MALILFHVSDRANRESIQRYGLDSRRMGAAQGIAGSEFPESQGTFLVHDMDEVKWFVEMGRSNDRRAIDVWEVSLDLELEDSVDLEDDLSEVLPREGPLSNMRTVTCSIWAGYLPVT
jgi:hypothetical protein